MRSWVVFKGPIRAALHKLKYRRDVSLGEALAWPLAEYVDCKLDWDVEMVVPVPLSPERLAQRGYNQVALLARPFALITNREYSARALRRVLYTRSQVGLSPRERRENVRNAFDADARFVRDRKVLLVDDVTTTGATLAAAACSLVQAGARDVYALTAARAVSRCDFGIV